MPPKPPTKSKYEQSLEKTVAGQTALRVNTNAVDRGSSSKYSVVIYSEGRYAGKARLLEWTPDGSRIATGRTISIEEANRLGGRGPAPRGNIDELRRQVNELKAVAPNASGRYQYANQTFTKAGWDAYVKPFEDRLAQLEAESGIRSEQARQQGRVGVDTEIARVNKVREQLTRLVTDFKDEADAATEIPAQDNYRRWADYYQAKLDELGRYVTGLDAGSARIGDVSTDFQQTDFTRAATVPPTTGEAQPRVSGPGQYGVMPSTSAGQVAPTGPVPAGQRGEQAMGAAPTTPSRMPTLDEVNKQRTAQGLRALVVRNGRVVDPTTGQEVPNVSTTAPGQGAVVTPTVPGGGTGGAAVGGTPTGTVPPAAGTQLVGSNGQVALIPPSWEEAARMEAGAWWDIFKDNEEMRKFIADWMARPMVPGADPFGEAFDLALRKTNWWRTTSATVRSWTELEASDPATASARLEANISVLKKLAMDRGLSTDEALLRKAGLDVSKFGLSPEVALNNLASGMLQTSTGASELRQGFYGQSVRQLANKYGISMSDSAITNNAGQVATGQQTLASLEAQFREQAKIMYPSLAGGLDRGLSFQDMASPYARYASSILEIPEEQIDFTDPKWSAAFNTRDNKGNLSQMSFSEWADYLRKDPQFGWEYTDNAKSQVYDIALQIGRMFGRAG